MWLWWRRARGWALIVIPTLVGAAVGVVAGLLVSDRVVGVVVGVAGAVVGVFAARGNALLAKDHARRGELPARLVHGRMVRVREATDPILLGVHPAAEDNGRVPIFVSRDVDHQLDDAVRRGGFVLLSGESAAGKSRAAYEAVRRLLPDYTLFAPSDGDSVATVVDLVLEQRRCVVWLDDIERFLGPRWLTVSAVNRMVAGGALLLATIRFGELDRFGARRETEQDAAARDGWRVAREVLQLATEITVPRRWTDTELARARQVADRRIQNALPMTERFGLAELLANGPELVRDWQSVWEPGRHPRGAALVAAAVDCRRAGLHEPVPVELLERLAEHYLAARGGPEQRPESLDTALSWATQPARGASSLLMPTGPNYLAFDYLVDVPTDVIPHAVWTELVAWVDPEQAMRVGLAARQFAVFDVVETAFDKGVRARVAGAEIEYANAVGESGRPAEAVERLTRALASLDPTSPDGLRVRGLVARYTGAAGNLDAATRMFDRLLDDSQRVLGADHPHTLLIQLQAAIHIGRTGTRDEAAELLAKLVTEQRRATGPDHHYTLRVRQLHAIWVGRAGHPETALELLDDLLADRLRVQGPDHPNVLSTRYQIAVWTSAAGRPSEAVPLCEKLLADSIRTLGERHPHTVSTRHRLAISARNAGQETIARREMTIVYEERVRQYGPDDTRTIRTREQLEDLDHRFRSNNQ